MKRTISRVFIVCLGILALMGCYKDKGNYDYKDINTITITADKPDDISILLQDTLRINITLQETIPSTAGLEYEWVLYQNIAAPLTRWAMGTSKDIKAQVTQTPGAYILDYFVKDKTTGVSFRKKFNITILSKFNEGWLVLEESGGHCDIAMVTPIDAIFKDIYSSANAGSKLPAGSNRISIVRDRLGVQKIYIMSPDELTQPYFVDFLKVASFNDQFWGAPAVKKPQEYFIGGSSNEMLINNGYPHGMNTLVPAPYKLGLQPTGTWDIAPFEIYSVSGGFICYDNLSQRFLKYNLTDLTPFAAPPAGAVFNVNNVNKKALYIGPGATDTYNCLFKNNNDDSLFAFKINAAAAQPALDTAYIPNTAAPGLLTATRFLSSRLLPHLYYVNGNTMYLLDIPARTARVVYTFPAGTTVTAMKMYVNIRNSSDPDNNRLIGVATMESGAGKLYTFPIGATGDFTGNTYRKMYTGFSKINDIALKWAP